MIRGHWLAVSLVVVAVSLSACGLFRTAPEPRGAEAREDESDVGSGKKVKPAPVDPKDKPQIPPEAGTYFYDLVIGDDEQEKKFEERVQIEPAKELRKNVFEQTTWNYDDYSDNTYSTMLWYPDGAYAKSASWPRNEYSPCFYDPVYLEWRLPMKVGDGWEANSECKNDERPRKWDQKVKVVDEETLRIDGAEVKTIVIETEWRIAPPNEIVSGNGKSWWSPEHRIVVKTSGRSRRQFEDGRDTGGATFERLIRSLVTGGADPDLSV
jgi:hypothetical protein